MKDIHPCAYMRKKGQQSAPYVFKLRRKFKVIHPFHPLYQREFELVSYRNSFGGAYVDYGVGDGDVGSIPLEWTNADGICPFVELSKGRSVFRVEELLRLVMLVDGLNGV